MGRPTSGEDGKGQRDRLGDLLAMGVDGVGGAPYLDPEPREATEGLVRIARTTARWSTCTPTRRSTPAASPCSTWPRWWTPPASTAW